MPRASVTSLRLLPVAAASLIIAAAALRSAYTAVDKIDLSLTNLQPNVFFADGGSSTPGS